MPDQQTQAASSPAEVDVFQGQQPSMTEYALYRQTGEIPARFKPTAPAGSEPVTEGTTPESGPDSDPEGGQEPQPKKKLTAEGRIAQIDAKIEELWGAEEPDTIKIAQLESTKDKIAHGAGLKRKTEAAPVAQQQAPPEVQPQYTRPKPAVDANKQDGTPMYASYEDYVEDLADWKAEQRIAQVQQSQVEKEALKVLKVKLDESRARYHDADEVIFPAARAIQEAHIPPAVKEVFAQSEYFTDLCYKVGSDPAELREFIQLAASNPRAALSKVFEYEQIVRSELEKATGKAPEKKQTQAPKPPSPVGGASSRAFDVNDESLSPEEWMRKRNAQRKA